MASSSNMHPVGAPATVVIRSSKSSWVPRPRELWQYSELLYFLAWRDIKVRYKQTVLGLLWAVVQPLAVALTLNLFLGHLVKIPSDGMPYPVFAYSAMVVWQLFSQALTESSNSLLVNVQLVSKVYFPRLLVPISSVLVSLLDFAVGLVVLALFLAYFRIAPTVCILALPLMIFLALLCALGIGLWLSALNVKYRDARHLVTFLLQFWFFATPIAYPASVVPRQWQFWYGLNPMVGVVEGFRWALRGTGDFPLQLVAISAGVSAVIFVGGLYYFGRTEDVFADFI